MRVPEMGLLEGFVAEEKKANAYWSLVDQLRAPAAERNHLSLHFNTLDAEGRSRSLARSEGMTRPSFPPL